MRLLEDPAVDISHIRQDGELGGHQRPAGFFYTWFCGNFSTRQWLFMLLASMHLNHASMCVWPAGYQVQGVDDVADGSRVLLTGDEQYILRMNRGTGNKVVLSDVQKGKATVLDGPIIPENADGVSVYIIDRVLKSGEFLPHPATAAAFDNLQHGHCIILQCS